MVLYSRHTREPGCVKTPTLNLRVEFPSRFRRCGKPIALATSVRRRQLRKQFCASLAQASFHTACGAGTTEPSRLDRVVRAHRRFIMRVFLGMILGALLLVAGVYIYDSMQTSTVANGQ